MVNIILLTIFGIFPDCSFSTLSLTTLKFLRHSLFTALFRHTYKNVCNIDGSMLWTIKFMCTHFTYGTISQQTNQVTKALIF
jgi:hypothetical protein